MSDLTETTIEKKSAVELVKLTKLLSSPMIQLEGKKVPPTPRANNIVCFCRLSASDLNAPQKGRALHHRCVLIVSLKTSVTVYVDDRAITLHPAEALIIFPFQFHDYMDPEEEDLLWLFVTFDLEDTNSLEEFRYKPFRFSSRLRSLANELIQAYLAPGHEELTISIFRHMLEKIKLVNPIERESHAPSRSGVLLSQVNQIMIDSHKMPCIKELADSIGISESHLRARFRESCGVSLGRHLRRLRLEKACGHLRMDEMRISEVAENCGFNSVYAFSRAFHHEYGVSPSAYRKERAINFEK